MIVAYKAEASGKQVLFTSSSGDSFLTDAWLDAIGFLIRPCEYGVVWNVDHFAELFCSLIPSEVSQELKEKGKAFLPMPYHQKLYYQPGRVFAITWGSGREINIYSLSRYSDKELSDVKELGELANRVVEAYGYFGLTPARLSSPVAVYGEILDKLDFPRACDLPDSALEMTSKCYEAGWVEWREVYKLGHWGKNEVTDLDISSAYPSLIAKLPDLTGAKFFTSEMMPDRYSFGILGGTLNITKDITPFLYVGKFPAIITTGQLRQLQKYQWGDFSMENGWFCNIPKGYKMPFAETMAKLYEAKQTGNELVKLIAKAISVGIGGKFNQRYDDGRLGDNFQPIYAKMITSACQCQVADMIWSRGLQDRVISVMVDGCLIEGDRISLSNSNGMGAWRVNPVSPFLVVSLLYQWGNDKKPNGQKYEETMSDINAKPKSAVYGQIDLNLICHDRVFGNLPKCGNDLLTKRYDSKPQHKEALAVS